MRREVSFPTDLQQRRSTKQAPPEGFPYRIRPRPVRQRRGRCELLFEMADGDLVKVPTTSFEEAKVLERKDLQSAIRDQISVLADDILVVSEEFGEFEDANRRIDLLCVDHEGRLVVVELKRTKGGGHMELQALRYAAMVSVMTFDDLAKAYETHLRQLKGSEDEVETSRAALLEWISNGGENDPVLKREVRIILASVDFSQEITTTVLWLNDVFGMDIRCIRLSPYQHHGRLLVDVQQLIPLPEAEALTIKLKKRESAVRAARTSRDYTKYVIAGPTGESEPLAKRNAVLKMVSELHRAGVACEILHEVIGPRFVRVQAASDDEPTLVDAIRQLQPTRDPVGRWFFDQPIRDGAFSWLLSNQGGQDTEETLTALAGLTNPMEVKYRAFN